VPLAFVQSSSDHFSCICALPLLAGDVLAACLFQKFGQSLDGAVLGAVLVAFCFGAVQGGVVRGGVVSHSVCHEFQEIRLSLLDYILSSLACRLEAGQRVIAVDSAAGDPEGNGPGDDPVRGILV